MGRAIGYPSFVGPLFVKTPPDTPEFARFAQAVRDILKVSKPEMQARMEAHRQSGQRLSKGLSSLAPVAAAKLRSAVAKRS